MSNMLMLAPHVRLEVLVLIQEFPGYHGKALMSIPSERFLPQLAGVVSNTM